MTARRGPDRVPVEPLREAVQASGVSQAQACRKMGWIRELRNTTSADTSRLERTLGLRSAQSRNPNTGKLRVSFAATVDGERAKLICEAVGADFDEVYAQKLPAERPRGGRCVSCGEQMLTSHPSHTCGFCLAELEEFGRVDQRSVAA